MTCERYIYPFTELMLSHNPATVSIFEEIFCESSFLLASYKFDFWYETKLTPSPRKILPLLGRDFFTYVPSRDCSNVFNCVQYKLKTVCFLLVFLLWENDSNLTSKKSIHQLSLQKGQISLQVNKYLYEQQ